jgi:hypothetical protein
MEEGIMVRDERNLEGKTCIFNTHGMDSEWKSYDGEKCKVKMRKPETEYDFDDIGTMWKIELEDGSELDAFSDELEECENNS